MIGEIYDDVIFGHLRFDLSSRSDLVRVGRLKDGNYGIRPMNEKDSAIAFTSHILLLPRAAFSLMSVCEFIRKQTQEAPAFSFGFRGLTLQHQLFRKHLSASGNFRDTVSKVAPAGYSEHHTGLAVGFGRSSKSLRQALPAFGWERSFGKRSRHGIAADPWHWRFAGFPAIERALIQGLVGTDLRALALRNLVVFRDDNYDWLFRRSPVFRAPAVDPLFLIAEYLAELDEKIPAFTRRTGQQAILEAGRQFLIRHRIGGADTLDEIRFALATLIPLFPNDCSPRVRRLRLSCRKLGLTSGMVTDSFDREVTKAVSHFQRIRGLARTGLVGPSLVRHIHADARTILDTLTPRQIAELMHGEWVGGEPKSLQINSILNGRTHAPALPGSLILAANVTNQWNNLTSYLATLNGSPEHCALLVDVDPLGTASPVPILRVPDTRKALENLARVARNHIKGPVIAVTGSSGKTTTKDSLRYVLSRQGITGSTQGSANDRYAVAIALIVTPLSSDYFIAECGLGVNGSPLDLQSRLLEPKIAIITNVHGAHAGGYSSEEAIALRKMEVASHLMADGTVFVDGDSAHLDTLLSCAKNQGNTEVVTFGTGSNCALRVLEWTSHLGGSNGTVSIFGQVYSVAVPHIGAHWGKAIACILGCGKILGLDFQQMISDLKTAPLPPGRGRLIGKPGQTLLVYDSHYNANPGSMCADLAAFRSLPLPAVRRIGIIGSMAELGDRSLEYHLALLSDIESVGFDQIVFVGEETLHLANAMKTRNPNVSHVRDSEEATRVLIADLQGTEAVFIKGSRCNHLEDVIDALLPRMHGNSETDSLA